MGWAWWDDQRNPFDTKKQEYNNIQSFKNLLISDIIEMEDYNKLNTLSIPFVPLFQPV